MSEQFKAGFMPEIPLKVEGLRFHPWRELSALALIGLEISWLIPWSEALRRGDTQLSSGREYLAFALNMAAAYWLARMMSSIKLRTNIRRGIFFIAFLAATAVFVKNLLGQQDIPVLTSFLKGRQLDGEILLPAEFFLALISGYVWLRGVSLAHMWIDSGLAIRRFSIGAGMFILLGFMTAFVPTRQSIVGMRIFALSGLIALGATRAASLGRLRGGRPTSFNAAWVAWVLISTTVVVALSVILGGVAADKFAGWVAETFIMMIQIFIIVAALLVSPIIFLLLVSWPWLQSQAEASPMLQEIGREFNRLVNLLIQMLVDLNHFMQGIFTSMPDLQWIKAWIIGGAVAGFLAFMLYWFGWRWRLLWSREHEFQEQTNPLRLRHVGGRLSRAIGEGLRRFGDRLRRAHFKPGILGALRIRVLYARLMRLCDDLGTPRGETVTPLEYLPVLGSLFPQAYAEVQLITEAYNRVRYGEIPETRAEVEVVETAWRRLRAEAKRLRQVRKQLDPAAEGRTRT